MAITLLFKGLTPKGNTPITIPAGGAGGFNDTTAAEIIMDFQGTLSGSYVQHGEPLDFTTATLVFPFGEWAPVKVEIEEIGTTTAALTGFIFRYVWGVIPTQENGAIQVFATGTASGDGLNELAAGAYSGTTPSLNGTILAIRAYFAKS